ncbi:hypothetical protein [Rhodococcus opacus]|uniref:hypothetical protein n=1 Tax=Rhodococcus opacus TaxID=37919 RepID=UPI001CECD112|nr:hypothetical protein [Rhodococcus opacus]
MPCCASGWRFCRNPFTDADSDDGYRYDLSVLQTESSLTHDLDAPGPSPSPPAPTSQACGSPAIVAMPCSPRCWFSLHPNGFTNTNLRTLTVELRGLDSDTLSVGQMTYDLRWLKTCDLIVRIECTQPLQQPRTRHSEFLTWVHDRALRAG